MNQHRLIITATIYATFAVAYACSLNGITADASYHLAIGVVAIVEIVVSIVVVVNILHSIWAFISVREWSPKQINCRLFFSVFCNNLKWHLTFSDMVPTLQRQMVNWYGLYNTYTAILTTLTDAINTDNFDIDLLTQTTTKSAWWRRILKIIVRFCLHCVCFRFCRKLCFDTSNLIW